MKKILAVLLVGILALTGAGAAFVVSHPDMQMEVMTNYVMENMKGYHWSAFRMEDPVTPALTQALGEDHPESVSAFYNYMKDSAEQMTWEIVSTDPQNLTAQVEVTYVDGVDFLQHYSDALCQHIMDSLEDGSLEQSNLATLMTALPDEKNRDMIVDSAEKSDPTKTQTATMTLQFAKQYGLCIPQGVSDEAMNVASSGLFQGIDGMKDMVAQRLIPQMVDRVFQTIQRFDQKELQTLTGRSLEEMIGMKQDSPLYQPFFNYLHSCAGKIRYTVGAFQKEEGKIEVECSFLDSKGVIQRYLEGAGSYIFSHLTHPVITDEVNARLLEEAIQASEEERVKKTVTITFDPTDYSQFSVSDEIQDVVSANLNREISGISEGFNQLANSLTGGSWKQMIDGLVDKLPHVGLR